MTIRKASENTVADGSRGLLRTFSTTLNGAGPQSDIIFTITQQIEITELYGIVTEATNATTCTTVSFTLVDTAVGPDITESVIGNNMSGAAVGSVIARVEDSSVNANFANAITCVVGEAIIDRISWNCILSKNLADNTYIVFNFTGDANTDIDITFYLRYRVIYDPDAINVAEMGGGNP